MTIYDSKKQFHDISHAAATAFNTKVSTAAYKLAKTDGYKNPNALLSALPDNAVIPSVKKEHTLSSLGFDDLFQQPWSDFTTFGLSNFNDDELAGNAILTAPLFVFPMIHGEVFMDKQSLCYPMEIYNVTQNNSVKHVTIHSSTNDDLSCFSLAALQSNLVPSFVITDTELLKMTFRNETIAEQLVKHGSIAQFSAICQLPDLIRELGLMDEVAERHIAQLNNLNLEKDEIATYLTGLPYIDRTSRSNEFKEDVLKQMVSPCRTFQGAGLKILVRDCDTPFMTILEDLFEIELSGNGSSYLYNQCVKLQNKMSQRDYALTELESNLADYLRGVFKIAELELIDVLSGCDQEDAMTEIVNFFHVYKQLAYILSDTKLNTELLLTDINSGLVLDHLLRDSLTDIGYSIFQGKSNTQKSIDTSQLLFKSVPEELLTRECILKTHEDERLLPDGSYVFREALSSAIKIGRNALNS